MWKTMQCNEDMRIKAGSTVLRVVLLCLLSLCLRGTEAQLVNQDNLAEIIKYIQTQYNPGGQYAVAINVPAKHCTEEFKLEDFKKVLEKDQSDNVKNVMKSDKKVLRVVLLCLLSLCLRGTEAADVDQNTLSLIIKYIQTNYGFGTDQFAVAISVPDEMCQAGVTNIQI
ncbi:hypothetical protein MHYP_G00205970 [Metynnis hypsauchen]